MQEITNERLAQIATRKATDAVQLEDPDQQQLNLDGKEGE